MKILILLLTMFSMMAIGNMAIASTDITNTPWKTINVQLAQPSSSSSTNQVSGDSAILSNKITFDKGEKVTENLISTKLRAISPALATQGNISLIQTSMREQGVLDPLGNLKMPVLFTWNPCERLCMH